MTLPTVHLTHKSTNAKTGPIPVSTTSAATCPTSCPLNKPEAGSLRCYAQKGPLALHWRAVTEGKRGMQWGEFCAEIAALPAGTLWRHNQAGDLPGIGDAINNDALQALALANTGLRGFTYTHKPYDPDAPLGSVPQQNALAIGRAVAAGFAINLSADTLAEADTLADSAGAFVERARPHVVVVVPKDHPERSTTPNGRPVIVCPEQTGKAKDCASCGLCARMDRTPIIAFRAH